MGVISGQVECIVIISYKPESSLCVSYYSRYIYISDGVHQIWPNQLWVPLLQHLLITRMLHFYTFIS